MFHPCLALALASALALPPASQTPVLRPGAPGQPSVPVGAGSMAAPKASAADIAFMQGMIVHHAQAIEMTGLVEARTGSAEMRLLAQRMALSQADEIEMIRRWLQARGAMPPGTPSAPGGMVMGRAGAPAQATMPGMLTPAQMQALAAAKGTAFDRRFLEGMIQHHGGALTMVRELAQAPGALQDAEIYDFASHVDADQRMEIIRMSQMLDQLKGIIR